MSKTHIGLIGRPGTGKSFIINYFAGEMNLVPSNEYDIDTEDGRYVNALTPYPITLMHSKNECLEIYDGKDYIMTIYGLDNIQKVLFKRRPSNDTYITHYILKWPLAKKYRNYIITDLTSIKSCAHPEHNRIIKEYIDFAKTSKMFSIDSFRYITNILYDTTIYESVFEDMKKDMLYLGIDNFSIWLNPGNKYSYLMSDHKYVSYLVQCLCYDKFEFYENVIRRLKASAVFALDYVDSRSIRLNIFTEETSDLFLLEDVNTRIKRKQRKRRSTIDGGECFKTHSAKSLKRVPKKIVLVNQTP